MTLNRWILVVDDEPDFRSIIEELFSQEGFRVRQANNGAAALDTLGENRADPPSLILLDMWMPGTCGMKFLEKLDELYPDISASVPILLCTASAKQVPAKFIRANRAVLAKPSGIEEILCKVHSLIDHQKAGEARSAS